MKFWQAYIFLFLGFISKFFAYSTNDTLHIKYVADSLFEKKNYYQAAIYYQKLDFFLSNEKAKNSAKLLVANCYKLSKDYISGINQLSSISLESASDSLIYNVKYQCALMSYLNNDLIQAEAFLQQLNYLVKDSGYVTKSLLLYALVLNEQYKWTPAKENLIRLNAVYFCKDSLRLLKNEKIIDSLYSIKTTPKLKYVKKAIKLSSLLPGLGQCYTKNYLEGLGSFLAAVTSVGIMVTGIVYQYYFTGIVTGNLLLGKFYLGGIKRTEFLANRYNYRISKTFNNKLKEQLNPIFLK
jgi:hypothetical protein